jgi:Phage protein
LEVPQWKGWKRKPDSIVDPDGNETTRAQLHNYFWIAQFARRLAYDRPDPRLHDEFERLLEFR